MEVTRDNFKDLYPQIEKEIKECEYLSLDCEFSGIGNCYLKFFDTQEERYQRKLKNEMGYDIVQFGLSIFTPDLNKAGEIRCSCYNFYIFKYHVKNSILPDYKLNISCSAFEFLSVNGFDFNKLFKQGITYCNVEEEQELRASLKRMNNELILNEKMDLKKQKLIYEALAEFNEFLKDSNKIVLELGPYDKSTLNLVKDKIVNAEKNRNCSPNTNLGLRKSGLVLKMRVNRIKNETNIYGHLRSLNQLIKKVKIKQCLIVIKIADEQIGFSKVIQAIIQHRKPIVGHNVLVDVMHIINQFIAPLPSHYEDFKFITREIFPFIFDTKHISVFLANLNKQKVKSLGELYEHFQNNYPQFVNIIKLVNSDSDNLNQNLISSKDEDKDDEDKDDEDKDDELKFHQAGFDSYITGVCFQVLKSLIELDSKKTIYEDIRFKNKFYNAWSLDIPFLTSEINQDAKLDRSNVYFIEFDCEPTYLENNILSTFKNYKIDYLTSNSCLVAILNGEAQKMLDIVAKNNEIHVTNYDSYKRKENKEKHQRPIKKIKVNDILDVVTNIDQIEQSSSDDCLEDSIIHFTDSKNSDLCNLNTSGLEKPHDSHLQNLNNYQASNDFNLFIDQNSSSKRKPVFDENKDWPSIN